MNMKKNPSEWDEHSEIMRLLGDRLVEIGWAKRVLTNKDGLFINWTPMGQVKISTLRSLMRELDYKSFTGEHVVAFFSLLDFLK